MEGLGHSLTTAPLLTLCAVPADHRGRARPRSACQGRSCARKGSCGRTKVAAPWWDLWPMPNGKWPRRRYECFCLAGTSVELARSTKVFQPARESRKSRLRCKFPSGSDEVLRRVVCGSAHPQSGAQSQQWSFRHCERACDFARGSIAVLKAVQSGSSALVACHPMALLGKASRVSGSCGPIHRLASVLQHRSSAVIGLRDPPRVRIVVASIDQSRGRR